MPNISLYMFEGDALQIQCYQCEEMKQNDCSTPEYIVNCTVNVQDMCQKEVLVKPDGKDNLLKRICLFACESIQLQGLSSFDARLDHRCCCKFKTNYFRCWCGEPLMVVTRLKKLYVLIFFSMMPTNTYQTEFLIDSLLVQDMGCTCKFSLCIIVIR